MRKSKLTPETIEKLSKAFALGATVEIACLSAGIGASTFYKWQSTGRAQISTGNLYKFVKKMETAQAKGALLHLQNIEDTAMKGDWKCSAWILERRWGYKRGGTPPAIPEESSSRGEAAPDLSLLDLLRKQAKEISSAAEKAAASQSWQAFAALHRQLLAVSSQISALTKEEGEEAMHQLSDEQLVSEIAAAIITLPLQLKEQLGERLQADAKILPFPQK